ncbi:trichohyalin-like [Topomyia yanbarensis]|uniref:trichohyalin-like n=1 Tax=Topomyia yanbarensis TaxID=2498891 RepID=UPI00273C60C0|nr:trichohyalin-like [Topomyia yanbarensis]XP_058834525.1 trichohyalin-like [Topomyia yanbarensis]
MPGGFDLDLTCSQSGYSRRRMNGDADDDGDADSGSIIPDRAGKRTFCRLCLTHSEKLRALFPPDSPPDPSLLAQIFDCVDVQITLPDDIKSFICADCIQQIYAFSSFKELCKCNDQLLKSQSLMQDFDDEESEDEKPMFITPEVTIFKKEQCSSFIPEASLLEKLLEQGVEVEAIGQTTSSNSQAEQTSHLNPEDREAERKAKNAARMRRWRMRQRQKQEQQLIEAQEKISQNVEQKDPPQIEQEDALRLQQAQELFAFFAHHQMRQVEAEIRRLKEGVQNSLTEQPENPIFKPEPQLKEEIVSRQSSPTSDTQMASLRRSRAEYMRKWRAKRQTQQSAATFGLVGRPPAVSPAQSETEKLVVQRHNRAEYMRRWRRERLKQELSPEEFDDWCIKSEQRRRFREWQVIRESGASSTGDDTMDYGERDAEESYSFEATRPDAIQS